jgi:hypothetical protein
LKPGMPADAHIILAANHAADGGREVSVK